MLADEQELTEKQEAKDTTLTTTPKCTQCHKDLTWRDTGKQQCRNCRTRERERKASGKGNYLTEQRDVLMKDADGTESVKQVKAIRRPGKETRGFGASRFRKLPSLYPQRYNRRQTPHVEKFQPVQSAKRQKPAKPAKQPVKHSSKKAA